MVAEYWLMLSFLGLSLTFTQVITGLAAARIALFLLVPGRDHRSQSNPRFKQHGLQPSGRHER